VPYQQLTMLLSPKLIKLNLTFRFNVYDVSGDSIVYVRRRQSGPHTSSHSQSDAKRAATHATNKRAMQATVAALNYRVATKSTPRYFAHISQRLDGIFWHTSTDDFVFVSSAKQFCLLT